MVGHRTIRDSAQRALFFSAGAQTVLVQAVDYREDVEGFMNLLHNLDLASREGPHQRGKILGLSWDRQVILFVDDLELKRDED